MRRSPDTPGSAETTQETEAWSEYLDSCRRALRRDRHQLPDNHPTYEDIEPWAWSRLQQRLRRARQLRAA